LGLIFALPSFKVAYYPETPLTFAMGRTSLRRARFENGKTLLYRKM